MGSMEGVGVINEDFSRVKLFTMWFLRLLYTFQKKKLLNNRCYEIKYECDSKSPDFYLNKKISLNKKLKF